MGIIQCGSFTGNTTVNIGWEPQWIMIKRTDAAGDWIVIDSMRGCSVGGVDAVLNPNLANAESVSNDYIDFTATGFITKNLTGTYIYTVIRRPNKPPKSGTEVYNAQAFSNNFGTNRVVGFPVDLVISKVRSGGAESVSFEDRLRGLAKSDGSGFPKLKSASAGAELTAEISTTYEGTDSNSRKDGSYEGGYMVVRSFFRRAPGFFDIVCYTGTGSNRTTPHDLAAVPDLLIVKSRSAATDWQVWCNGLAANEKLVLNSNAGKVTDATAWNGILPTSTNISLGTSSATNANGATFIAYAFSNLPGIQKIGTYVGDGTSGRVIDCGFSTGARFVCIKAISTTGSWLVSDSARGIVSGNDPYLQLNSTEAEVTTEDWLDPSSVGFIVNNVSSSNANASGVTYMYWAIA